MIRKEQQKDFEQALDIAWKDYVDRGAATVDALEENTQELAFAKGFKAGYEQGYKDAVIKACGWLLDRMWEKVEYEEIYVTDGEADSVKEFVDDFKKHMEE